MNCTALGIDLAKQVFQLHGVDKHGQVIVQKRVTRRKLRATIAQLPSCLIGMEACSSAQYWARELQQLGHTVKLISLQFVKPYVKGNKNDSHDAEAICEAVSRPHMRFVPLIANFSAVRPLVREGSWYHIRKNSGPEWWRQSSKGR
jgi:transposase